MPIKKYVRFETRTGPAYGLVKKDRVHRLRGDLFGRHTVAEASTPLDKLKLLAPIQPGKIFAVGLNYRSHLNGRPEPSVPEIFYKPVSALQNPGGPIEIPPTSTDMHYEGEMVLIIGKRTRLVTEEQARDAIWGVACGNDVSEREWQRGAAKDLQWWRAKGCDTFAPLGPFAVRGLDYNNLQLTTRLNGEVVQQQTTADLIFPAARIVSFLSTFITLEPGDLIYTGTPGSTRRLSPGDVVEVELAGAGVLRNPVAAPRSRPLT